MGVPGPVAPDTPSWNDWTSLAQHERVVPQLYRLVDTVATNLTDEQREAVGDLQAAAMSRCVRLEHHAIDVTRLLADHSIRSVVLKGSATAHLDYPDPAWRDFNDVDVLLAPADRKQATALLQRYGWTQGYTLPTGHEEYTHAVTFVRDGVELDLHQRVGRRALGMLVPTPELLDHAVAFETGGCAMLALDDIDRLIHSAVHAVAARYPLRMLSTLTDVLVMAHRRPGLAGEALARAEHWRLRSIVERGIRDAYAAARLELHPEWAAAMRAPIRRRDRLIDLAYATPRRRAVVEELAYLRVLDGFEDRWRYLRGYFSTDTAYAAQRGRSGVRAQLKYVLRKLRRRS